MKKHARRKSRAGCGSVIAAISLTLFIFSAAVVITLNSRWLYYLDISLLHIEAESGLSTQVIKANYNALIDYCMVRHRSALVFPTLTMSQTGRIHFEECKVIFDAVQITCAVTLVTTVISAIALRRKRRTWLKAAGILSLLIPIVLGILAAVGWDRFFVTFHQLFFKNDYWLFDPVTDPVILMLPDAYFLHCAVLILVLIALGAVISLRLSRRRR